MKEKGITFQVIDPSYTSQKCSRCGYINRNNRKRSYFLCRSCGNRSDADRNAAINIKQDYIHNSIQLFVETETPLLFHIQKRQNLAEEGISIFIGAQISSPYVAT